MDKIVYHSIKPITNGKCVICEKITNKTCPRCLAVFYCNKDHRNQDWTKHKKTCEPVKTIKKMQLKDLCDIACEVFFGNGIPHDGKQLMFETYDIFGIKTQENLKYFLLKKIPAKLSEARMLWYQKDYKSEDFYSVFCVEKAYLFHYAFVAAMRCLINEHGITIEHEGKDVLIFGTAYVKLKKPFQKIIQAFDWTSKDESKWKLKDVHSEIHEVIWATTGKTGHKIIIDFCGPAYNINNMNDKSKPLVIVDYDKQDYYHLEQLFFPDHIDKQIEAKLKECKETFEKTGMQDFRPITCIAAKKRIVELVLD